MKPTLAIALAVLSSAAAHAETIHGTLLDTAGKPLPNIRLTGFALNRNGSRTVSTDLRATTGKDGKFTLENAPAKPTPRIPVWLMAQFADGRFAPVRLEADGGVATWPQLPTAALVVTATDSEGKPIQGAKATLRDAILLDKSIDTQKEKIFFLANLGETGPSVTTDAHGMARFEGVPVGAFTKYVVSRDGLLSGSGELAMPSNGIAATTQMGPAAIVSGRVLREGKPVPNVQVLATTMGSRSRQLARATTNANGEYRIADSFPGSLVLTAELGKLSDEWIAVGPGSITVAAGQERNGLNLVLDRGVLLKGQVLTSTSGKPVNQADIVVMDPGGSLIRRVSDKEGRFTARVAPGSWYVSVNEVAGIRLNTQVQLQATVDAKNNPPLELRVPDAAILPPIPNLAGVVTDSDGKPVAEATVRNLMGGATTKTDKDGNFRFDKPTEAGNILIAAKGDAMSSRVVVVMDKPSVGLVLDGKSTTLQGVLTDDDGKPLSDVEVTLGGKVDSGYVYIPATKTDGAGAYRFEGLYGGLDSFFLWAKKPGYGSVTIQPIRTKPGEQKTLEKQAMALADGIIEGKVLDVDGKPAGGVRVSSQVNEAAESLTDAEGRFRLTGIPRGKHYVIAIRGNMSNSGASGATGQTDLVIQLKPEPKAIPGLVTGSRVGANAPELKVATWTNNGSVDLTKLKGKIVVIDLWAVWCAPCVATLPDMEKLSQKYASRNVTVIGIHAPGTPKDKVIAFVKEKKLTYPIAIDVEEDSGAGVTAKAFGFSGIPHFIVIDVNGKVVADSNEHEDVEKAIKKLLGES